MKRQRARIQSDFPRRGSTYILVLGTALVVSVLGLAGLLVVRVQRVQVRDLTDVAQASMHGRAGLDMALLRSETEAKWRQDLTNGVWETDIAVGQGFYSFSGTDPDDGDLTDSSTDPVMIVATGKQGAAVQKFEMRLEAYQAPLEALRMAAHSAQKITVTSGTVTVSGAALSTNLDFTNRGSVAGDIQCQTYGGSGTCTGTIAQWAGTKPLPSATVFDTYKALATALPYSGDLDKDVLAPGVNTYGGGTNSAGVYFIDATGRTFTIKGTRVHGTMVIAAGRVVLDDEVLLHNYNVDYPTLIVKGVLELKLDSGNKNLSETTWATNFNRSGAAYDGYSDSDQADKYPNEIQGLVHVQGDVFMRKTSRLRGVLLSDGKLEFNESPELIHDPTIWYRPPLEYVAPVKMRIAPGSVQQR